MTHSKDFFTKVDIDDWQVWDYTSYGPWKFSPNAFSYSLFPEHQVLSTLNGEPAYNGEIYSEERKNREWVRLDISDVVLFIDYSEKIITLLSPEEEIKTKAWWLWCGSKWSQSQDWKNAVWEEL